MFQIVDDRFRHYFLGINMSMNRANMLTSRRNIGSFLKFVHNQRMLPLRCFIYANKSLFTTTLRFNVWDCFKLFMQASNALQLISMECRLNEAFSQSF